MSKKKISRLSAGAPGVPAKQGREAGQASRLLLVLAVVVLVAVIITYLIMRMAEQPAKPVAPITTKPSLPVYEQTLGNIRFIFESAIDKGSRLKASDIRNSQYISSWQQDLVISNSGAKFIQVTVGAQNMGTENTEQNTWDIGNIVDSQGRNFVPIEQYNVSPWLPAPNLCGALLKPAFAPSPCTKIYEVSKESSGLKIKVTARVGNNYSNKDSFLLDLIVK